MKISSLRRENSLSAFATRNRRLACFLNFSPFAARGWNARPVQLKRFWNARCGPSKRNSSSGKTSQAWGQESEEEIFSLAKGWKINPLTLAPEENLSDVGIVVPPKMKPKTRKEKNPGAQVQSATEAQKERLIHRKLKVLLRLISFC